MLQKVNLLTFAQCKSSLRVFSGVLIYRRHEGLNGFRLREQQQACAVRSRTTRTAIAAAVAAFTIIIAEVLVVAVLVESNQGRGYSRQRTHLRNKVLKQMRRKKNEKIRQRCLRNAQCR